MRNPHVLVVDDEADIRALIKDILSDEGYGVAAAANASEARAARASHKFDLILLDIVMPGEIDGLQLADQIEAIAPEVQIIMCSGYSPKLAAGNRMRPGRRFLSKPVSRLKLAQTVREAIDS